MATESRPTEALMKRIVLFILLCLLLAFAEATEKKKKAPEEKIAYDPSFTVTCFPPVITKEKIVLKALHPLGYYGKTPTVNEIILRIEIGTGIAVVVSNINYAADDRGVRTSKDLPAGTPTLMLIYRYCLRTFPENVRALLAGREMDLMVRPK